MLAGSLDRERAVDVLRAGFTEGRLTQEEFNERVARAYQARTYGDLGELTADLPAGPIPPEAGMAVFDGPVAGRPSANWTAPSVAGLALTAVVVFTLAALITGIAVYLHAHGQSLYGPFPRTRLEPYIRHHQFRG